MTYQALVQSKPHLIAYSRMSTVISGQFPSVEYTAPGVTMLASTANSGSRTGNCVVTNTPRLPGSPDSRTNAITYVGNDGSTTAVPDWMRTGNLGTISSYAFEFWGYADTVLNPNLFNDANGIVYDTTVSAVVQSSSSFTRSARAYRRVNDIYFGNGGNNQETFIYTMPRYENTWNHYVIEVEKTTNGNFVRIFLDGVKVLEQAATITTESIIQYHMYGGYSVTGGTSSWTYGWTMSDVAFWGNNTNQRAISDADVLERYNYGKKYQYYDGTAWKASTGQKYYDGTSWVDWNNISEPKTWNGTEWVNI